MTNINDNLRSSELADIVNSVFNLKHEVDFDKKVYGFAQVHFNVKTLSANKVREVNRIIYDKTGGFGEWSTMVDSGHCLDNPTILVHLSFMHK